MKNCSKVRIDRVWAMPHKWTFTIKPIRELLIEEIKEYDEFIDPFAGPYGGHLARYTNDINTSMNSNFNLDALDYLQMMVESRKNCSKGLDGALLDWPYSNNQYRVCYKQAGKSINPAVFNAHYQAEIKDRLSELIRPHGKCISFGWNSNGLGKKRGFEITRILMVAHGRLYNDTIVTVEKKKGDATA